MNKKVVIIGAGPVGLLLAHYLLRRDSYQVDIYERRSDPRLVSFSKSRSFPVVINQRGIEALSNIEGVFEALKATSVESNGSIFHLKNGQTRVVKREKPIYVLDRIQIVITLLETLTQKYDSNRLNIYFDHQCKQVDFDGKIIKFENVAATGEICANYDLLIGTDGAKSQVREKFLSQDLFELEQKYIPYAYKSIFLTTEQAPSLQTGYVHGWRVGNGITVLLVPLQDGTIGGTITFPRQNNPMENFSTTENVVKFFEDKFPEISKFLPLEEAEAFLNRPTSHVVTIRCSHYHYNDSVLLLGDAAHATSPSLGQGCNSGFEDVVIVNNLLDEYSDSWAEALPQFTLRRKPDAHALVELSDNVSPMSGTLLFYEYLIRLRFGQILHQLFPKSFSKPLFQLALETNVSYSEILNTYHNWIKKVKRSNQKYMEKIYS